MSVLVVGEALVDVVTRGDDTDGHPGGSPFNVAVGLSRLGVRTTLAAQVGDDPYGTLLRQHLAESGVDLEALAPTPPRTSSARATLAADGSATYDFDLTWDPAELPDPSGFEAVHVGSLGTQLAPGADLVAGLVAVADAVGVPVSYDPNVRLAVEPDADVWRAVFASVAPHARLLKLSDEDAAVLFPGEAPDALVSRLAADGALVVLTLGGEGAVLATAEHLTRVTAPPTSVVDTIGAGDSFMAAMLAWAAAYDWPRSSELDATELADLGAYAARAAALTVSRPGADPPTADELG